MLHGASTTGDAKLVRCPKRTLERLRHLNEAEIITLFTPIVPHPPSTTLAKDMDPFEPLGRVLPRKVRHVPYHLDYGKTETHADFLPSSGAVIVVVCATANVLGYDAQAFEKQLQFARGIAKDIKENKSIASIPFAVLFISDDAAGRGYINASCDLPAVITANDYTAAALNNAVRVLFGI
ncbi:hypothetical protein GGP41_008994 [Bipolaris sorokiniana]|uniref:Uncharacterized protein n=2 Tax=Cochliobolus sativus TaxID=45130 RepID=A0A8H6DTD9_COCSA|nr:uncharacterized protein COCSADRAFT_40350 [Bipolaris sorokiniana ND90Pr]EMD59869.1 hypothetical protein COCSADRAFT_40350 [Bipolaris sorokiniana ND90Pr]KAF5847756.1 hypothetical protein GGP41_008994 [Bipolaris sorokiniana]